MVLNSHPVTHNVFTYTLIYKSSSQSSQHRQSISYLWTTLYIFSALTVHVPGSTFLNCIWLTPTSFLHQLTDIVTWPKSISNGLYLANVIFKLYHACSIIIYIAGWKTTGSKIMIQLTPHSLIQPPSYCTLYFISGFIFLPPGRSTIPTELYKGTEGGREAGYNEDIYMLMAADVWLCGWWPVFSYVHTNRGTTHPFFTHAHTDHRVECTAWSIV